MNLIMHLWFYIIIAFGGSTNTNEIQKPIEPQIEINKPASSTEMIDIVDIDRWAKNDLKRFQ